ncbi:putative gustatory receptor 22a [Drosophila ficusphila]|uniref:putative gustatory receptor 22a n=1 Tax=Drosophila ficusphila TaxID=30025 RepID=UPI0007E8A307|nr:putative gustatory receptor 22a [Drosophila ficusphila]
MLQPNSEHRFRRSLAQFILKATLYGSWVLGLFPFFFDSRRRCLQRSKWLLAYGVILNLTLIALSLLPATDDHNAIKVEVFHQNPLVSQLEILLDFISCVALVGCHLRNACKSKELSKILNEFLMLEHRHFSELILKDCPQFDRYVIFKGLTVFLEIASSLVIYFGMPDSNGSVLEAVCIYVSQLAALVLVMHFHLAVIYIYRLVWIINGQLLDMATRLRRGDRVDPERVNLLLFLYSRVLDLNSRLAKVYDLQITIFMLIMMSANILLGHVMVIFWINVNNFFLPVLIWLFIQALIINLLDLWLSIASCDLPESASRKTSLILKLFNDIENIDQEMERRISEFTLFCSHRRLKINQLGMFDINYEIGCCIFITNISYVLCLVQFDYYNLKFK